MTDMMGQGDCVRMSVIVGIASLWPGVWMLRDVDFNLGYVTRGQNIQMLMGLKRDSGCSRNVL